MSKKFRQDEQHKRVLEANCSLLVKNVIHTPDLHNRLITNKIITESMLKDVQEGRTQQEMNERLIKVLKLRNKIAFRKFTYALLFTGHSLLADFLHDEEQSGAQYVSAADVERHLPSVAGNLGLDDIKKLCHYMESKIKAEVAKKMWNNSSRERDRVEEMRKEFFHREEEKQRLLERSQQKISQLEATLEETIKEKNQKDHQVKEFQSTLQRMENDHKDVLAKQVRFNTANNSTIMKLSERLVQFTGHITELTHKLQQSVGEIFNDQGEYGMEWRYGHKTIAVSGKGKAEDKLKMAELDSVISRLLRAAQNFSEDIKAVENNRTKERETVLTLLGSNPRDRQITVSDVIKQFLSKENKEREHLCKEIQVISSTLKDEMSGSHGSDGMSKSGHNADRRMIRVFNQTTLNRTSDFRALRAMLGMLREEIQHIGKRLQWKEAQIRALEEENTELKTGFSFQDRHSSSESINGWSLRPFPGASSPPLKHKILVAKNRRPSPKKSEQILRNRRKQRVLSPIEEIPNGKSSNNIVFQTMGSDSIKDVSKPIQDVSKPISIRA